MSQERLRTPVKHRRIIFERVQGCALLILGIFLITSADADDATDFESAVRTVVTAEGLSSVPSEPPDELRVVSARYGARETWIDVTEEIRQKVSDNTLEITASNAIAGDPLYGVPKILQLQYLLDGEHKTAALWEGATLRIPASPYDVLNTITTAERLRALALACPAEIGFYGKNFTTGKTVAHRPDQPACLASIVKLFALLEVMRQVDQRSVELSASMTIQRYNGNEVCTVSEALDKMIGASDNEATAALAELVGNDEINALPRALGIAGLSDRLLPRPGVLKKVLDKRVYDLRIPGESDLLPQHGTARAVVRYLELLSTSELVNESVSRSVLEVLDRNPKVFAPRATPPNAASVGKGGSIVWVRPFRPAYNMSGWGILIRNEDVALGFCLWSEWFPARMSQEEQRRWLSGLSDCIVNILLLPVSDDEEHEDIAQPVAPADPP